MGRGVLAVGADEEDAEAWSGDRTRFAPEEEEQDMAIVL